jgi:hypothetical protein
MTHHPRARQPGRVPHNSGRLMKSAFAEQASRLLGRGRLCQFVCLSRNRRSKAQDGAPLCVIPTEETLVTERRDL